MKNLFVYGDSYSSNDLDHITKSWTTMLAESLDVNLENRAVSGSSTHYQFLKLIEDYTADRFKHGDKGQTENFFLAPNTIVFTPFNCSVQIIIYIFQTIF